MQNTGTLKKLPHTTFENQLSEVAFRTAKQGKYPSRKDCGEINKKMLQLIQ